MVVTFHMIDREFKYYSEVDWEEQLESWLEELGETYKDLTTGDADEIVALMFGGYLAFERTFLDNIYKQYQLRAKETK